MERKWSKYLAVTFIPYFTFAGFLSLSISELIVLSYSDVYRLLCKVWCILGWSMKVVMSIHGIALPSFLSLFLSFVAFISLVSHVSHCLFRYCSIIFARGRGESGCLGHGNTESKRVPTFVEAFRGNLTKWLTISSSNHRYIHILILIWYHHMLYRCKVYKDILWCVAYGSTYRKWEIIYVWRWKRREIR
jgi:hypothetical protein